MFFQQKLTIIYLQKDSAIFYTKNNPNGDIFTFSERAIKNEVIQDQNEFCEGFKTFLIQNSLKPSGASLILSSDLFIQKEIKSKEAAEQKKEVEEFVSHTKISEENLNKETFELDNILYVMALDKSFYTSFIHSAETLGFSIPSVVPISLFRDINDTKIKKSGISVKELKEIVHNSRLVREASIFKRDLNVSNQPEPSLKKSSLNLTYIGIGICCVVIVTSLVFLIQSGAVSQITNSVLPKPTPTTTPMPTPTPKIAFEEDKSKLKVKVLNGTGVTGQAGKVKTALIKLDYSDITTANADNQENTETTVTVSSKVSPENADEIVTSLEELFETVSKKSEDGDFDITILTGKEK